MALVAASCILRFLPLLLLAATEAATFNITNRCSYTVWAAALPVGGGERLDPGETWAVDVPAGTVGGRVWARTGCSFDRNGSNGRCQTGDCGGVLACTGYGQPPTTIAEFALGQANDLDLFDISLVVGYNVPMEFLPARGGAAGRRGAARGRAARPTSRRGARASCRRRGVATTRARCSSKSSTAAPGRWRAPAAPPASRCSSRTCARTRTATPWKRTRLPRSLARRGPTTRSCSVPTS